MKNLYAFLFLAAMGTSHAQVPNAGFEEGIGYGNDVIRYWGQLFVLSVGIDIGTGETFADTIIYEEGQSRFSFPTSDAHSGERAMKITNAFNVTQNQVIAGGADLFNEDVSTEPTGWNTGHSVAPDANIDMFGFYYKFSPLGNDIAQATLKLFGESNELVGMAVIDISGATTGGYSYVSTPIEVFSQEVPVFMTIGFSMAKEGSVPVFGSSLIIDDVAISSTALHTNELQAEAFSVYPTVAGNVLNILKSDAIGNLNMAIVDMNGRTVRPETLNSENTVDVSTLSGGMYFLKAVGENGQAFTAKFIKSN